MKKKKEKEFLSEEEKRTILMGTKVNQEEAEKIKSLAEKCGMTVSRYMRETALGYKIYDPLSPEEKEAMGNIANNRVDLLKFMSVFNGLSRSDRLIFFKSEEAMEQWITIIDNMIDNLQDFLNTIYSKSRR